jgi:hypothetical protein
MRKVSQSNQRRLDGLAKAREVLARQRAAAQPGVASSFERAVRGGSGVGGAPPSGDRLTTRVAGVREDVRKLLVSAIQENKWSESHQLLNALESLSHAFGSSE